MRPQPRRCARPVHGAPAPRHFLPDRVRHWARGGCDGDGTSVFGGRATRQHGWGQFSAKRQHAGEQTSRVPAGEKRSGNGGRRTASDTSEGGLDNSQYRRGRATPEPRHFLPDRVRHRARGGQSTGRTFTGGANSARKRHSCRNTQHAAFRPKRSAEAGGWLLMFSDTHARGSCRHRQRCPARRRALRSRYSPGSDRCTPDLSPPGR